MAVFYKYEYMGITKNIHPCPPPPVLNIYVADYITCLLVSFSGALDKQTNKQIQKHVLH